MNWRSFERAIKLTFPLSLGRGSIMTAEGERERPAPEAQELDEIEASVAAIEQAVLRSVSRDREAVHELGCRIVAQALRKK